MNLPGLFAASESSRVYVTLPAVASSAFFEIKTRPVVVAAHRVAVSELPRATAATLPPVRACTTIVCRIDSQPCRAGRPDREEVTAGRVSPRGCKFRAVGFKERLVACPILSPPDTQRTLEDCACTDRIRNDWRVKHARSLHWRRSDHSR